MGQPFSGNTQRKFDAFEGSANKTNPSHPLDQQRWRDFVITAHEEDQPIQDANLYDELYDRGWPDDHAMSLAIDYQKGRDLLKDYDRKISP